MRLLARSAATVPETLWDRELFLKPVGDSYEMWAGTQSGPVRLTAPSSVTDVDGLQALVDAINAAAADQLDTINAIIADLYGDGEPGSGIPSNSAFPSLEDFETLQDTVSGLAAQIDAANTQIGLRAYSTTVSQIADDLDGITTRMEAAETAYQQNASQIALKASQTDLTQTINDLGDINTRLTAAEGSLTVQSGQIALKASQTDLTQTVNDLGAINTRLTAAEGSLLVQADELAAKVSTSTWTSFLNGDFETVLTRISSAETALELKADSATLTSMQNAFDVLGNTVGTNTAQIELLAGRISSQVTATIIGAVDGPISGTRTSIPLQEGVLVRLLDGDEISIVSAATGEKTVLVVDTEDPVPIGSTSVPIVSASVTAADGDVVIIDGVQILSRIDQFGNQIGSMVSQTYVDAQYSLLQTQIEQTESNILLQAAALGANDAIATTLNTGGTTVSLASGLLIDLKTGDKISVLTKPSNSVVIRTVTADANAGTTSIQVNSSVTSEAGGVIRRVEQGGASLIGLINITPGEIDISADKINLTGVVKFSNMADAFGEYVTTIDGAKITTGSITADKLAANVVQAVSISAGSVTADKIAAGAITADKIAAGTITADKFHASTVTALAADIENLLVTDLSAVNISADQITTGTLNSARLNLTGELLVNTINSYGGVLKINADKVQFAGSGGIEVTDPAAAINVGTTKILWDKIQVAAIESNNWGLSAGMQIDLTAGTLRTGGSSSPKVSIAADGTLTATGADITGALKATSGRISGSVVVGNPDAVHILLDGTTGKIRSSNYAGDGVAGFEFDPSTGWLQTKAVLTGGLTVWGDSSLGFGGIVSVDQDDFSVKLAPEILGNPGKIGFYGASAVTKPTVSGSRGGNAALNSLLSALATLGLVVNSTSA